MYIAMKLEDLFLVGPLTQILELRLRVRLWLGGGEDVCREASEWAYPQATSFGSRWVVRARELAGQRLQPALFKRGAVPCDWCSLACNGDWHNNHPDCDRYSRAGPKRQPRRKTQFLASHWPFNGLMVAGTVSWAVGLIVSYPLASFFFGFTGLVLVLGGGVPLALMDSKRMIKLDPSQLNQHDP